MNIGTQFSYSLGVMIVSIVPAAVKNMYRDVNKQRLQSRWKA